MAVRQGEIGQVSTASLGHAKRVEGKQARQHMVVATGQPRLDKEGPELVAIKPEPG